MNENNLQLGKVRSVIRELFEYGKRLEENIGKDCVFDFSLGNPNVPAPKYVIDELERIIKTYDPIFLHGYTSATGDCDVRRAVANDLNSRFAAKFSADDIYMTCGAAASLAITLNAILNRGDEVIAIAPYFPEYNVFVSHAGGALRVAQSKDKTFQIDVDKIKAVLSDNTRAVIINSPNNPSGVVYTEESISALADLLKEHKRNTGNTVYIISDEPYRELVYGGIKVPFITDYYDDSVVCYSFSKSLSLPGERIGYIAINSNATDRLDLRAAIAGSGRALGYVCAPNLFQQLIKNVLGKPVDVSVYENNRNLLCGALEEFGYEVVKPDGAFYAFIKTPSGDSDEFMERAKNYGLLVVSSNSFGVSGYARVAYCVSTNKIIASLPHFRELLESYNV